jgi:hypothetical protein
VQNPENFNNNHINNPLPYAITTSCQSNTFDEGVVINGVRWVTRNVDEAGAFAGKPEDAGMFYQWNRKKAWNATGDFSNMEYYKINYTEWEKVNDPSPESWRIPTMKEFESLLDEKKVRPE